VLAGKVTDDSLAEEAVHGRWILPERPERGLRQTTARVLSGLAPNLSPTTSQPRSEHVSGSETARSRGRVTSRPSVTVFDTDGRWIASVTTPAGENPVLVDDDRLFTVRNREAGLRRSSCIRSWEA